MKLIKVKEITDIKENDTLIITGGGLNKVAVRAEIVKISGDGTEIIFDKKNNRFFNLGMFLEGKSWVKDLRILRELAKQQK